MKGNTGRLPSRRKQVNDFAVVSNQWQSNPKQQSFLEYYFEPKSNTYGNVYKSAIKAGYSDSHARTLTRKKNKNMWLQEYLAKQELSPEHIIAGITSIATNPSAQDKDKLKGYELLAKLQGMMIDKSITATVNIEQVLSELK